MENPAEIAANLQSNATQGHSTGGSMNFIVPTIDHNHPLYLQPKETPGGNGGNPGRGHYDSQYNPIKTQKPLTVCEVCGFRGHTKDQYFKVKEYPVGWKSKRKTGNVKGIGREDQGLYILKDDFTDSAAYTTCSQPPITSNTDSNTLWHKIPGYAPVEILKKFGSLDGLENVISHPSTVCPLAKQSKLPFPGIV